MKNNLLGGNMLDVNIEKILPVTEVRDSLNKIIDDVENTDELYVVTKNGKPTAIVVGVHHLEKLTGIDHKEMMPDSADDKVKDKPAEMPIDVLSAAADTASAETTSDWSKPLAADTSKDDSAMDISPVAPVAPVGVDSTENSSSTPAADTTNGAQASPIAAAIAPAPASADAGLTPPAANNLTGTGDSNDIDDIFGPVDEEPETPATPMSTPAVPVVSPAPMTPATSVSPATIAAAPPAPSTPPSTPGQA